MSSDPSSTRATLIRATRSRSLGEVPPEPFALESQPPFLSPLRGSTPRDSLLRIGNIRGPPGSAFTCRHTSRR